jgi:hypothetical protein
MVRGGWNGGKLGTGGRLDGVGDSMVDYVIVITLFNGLPMYDVGDFVEQHLDHLLMASF